MLLLITILLTPAPAHAQGERVVLAFYYAWYERDSFGNNTSDQPVQPYGSSERATIERHVSQARAAGIDALVQSWYGPGGGASNPTESNFRTLLDVIAVQGGLRAAVDFEAGSPFFATRGDVQSALATLLATHVRHPGYLTVGGKPVIFFWYNTRFGVDDWQAIRDAVDPNRSSIWIAEGTNTDYLRVFDGLHLYSIAWSANPQATLNSWGSKVRAKSADLGAFKYWVSTAMPGWDDTRTGRANAYARSRADGEYYRQSFNGATSSGADWVVVTSFNEWVEGSQIEPSVTYGDFYLERTRDFANAFRNGQEWIPTPTPTVTATPSQTPTPTQTPTASDTPTNTLTPTSTDTPTPTPTETPSPTLAPSETSTPSPSATVATTPTLTPIAIARVPATRVPSDSAPNAAPAGPTPTGTPNWIGPVMLGLAAVLAGFTFAGRLRR